MRRIPLSVIRAGGPHSSRSLSKRPGRVTNVFFSRPAESSKGYQSYRFSDQARLTKRSPQYIQYFPLILASTNLLLTIFVIIEADLLAVSKNRPSCAFAKAGPFFNQ